MKIDNSVKPLDALVGGARKEAARPASSRSAAGQGDAVALSPLSARLQEMEAAMAASPVVDADRVSAIRPSRWTPARLPMACWPASSKCCLARNKPAGGTA